ncbi:MAG: hypothetical protein L7U68_01775 [Flavobacteriaceae bacterium]|nr:hypothetical protein [Flavobacteriaceae bacterium]
MRNKEKLIGAVIGFVLTFIGMVLFTLYFSEANIFSSFKLLYQGKKLGSLISLGALLNLPVFFILIRRRDYQTASGLVSLLILLVVVVAILKVL